MTQELNTSNNQETSEECVGQSLTIKERVQKIRNAMKRKQKMEMVNRRMVEIAENKKDITNSEKTIENIKKNLEVAIYETGKLDENHPNYEEMKSNADKTIESKIKVSESNITDYENSIKLRKENIERLEKEIDDVETGVIKISLDKLNTDTATAISKL